MIPLEEIRRRLAGYAPGTLPLEIAHDDYDDGTGLKPAAVLVPLVAHRGEASMLLTVRNARMKAHAGQVAFPGGRCDDGETAERAALREAEEEVALDPAQVEILGTIDDYITGTGYRVTPVVGIVPPGLDYRANPAEVSDIFELPLTHALNDQRHLANEAEWRGRRRRYFTIDWPHQNVWGATAGIIVNLTRILTARA